MEECKRRDFRREDRFGLEPPTDGNSAVDAIGWWKGGGPVRGLAAEASGDRAE
jgi:hypothetical protein